MGHFYAGVPVSGQASTGWGAAKNIPGHPKVATPLANGSPPGLVLANLDHLATPLKGYEMTHGHYNNFPLIPLTRHGPSGPPGQ